jgi:MtrB/PioB family decaheme-associated outer membrane protein
MKMTNRFIVHLMLALLSVPATVLSQEQKGVEPKDKEQKGTEQKAVEETRPELGMIEFGVRHIWGDVYGRPDLPFNPSLGTSKYNEYRDIRNGFFIRRFGLYSDNVLGSNNYISVQSEKSIYKDQTYLATFGQYGKFKVQFRYDEIPHVYSDTARTPYIESAPGVFTIPLLLRTSLQAINSSTALPSTIQNQLVPGFSFYTPQILRRTAGGMVTYKVIPEWTLMASFFREHQSGTRPIGQIFNSSPSAALSGGYGAELPEPINYFNDTFKAGTEYGRHDWGVQFSYLGSFFQNNIGELVFDNPFRTTDCVAPTNCTAATQGPATGRVDLYPDNSAQYLNFAGAFDLTKRVRLMASITPGWLRQNDNFLPYTTNSILQAQTGPLPAASLHGEKQTLAMNYTLVTKVLKNVELKAAYRHYDYNNNTAVHDFTPVLGDFTAADLANPEENRPFGYNKKTFELTGNWFFAKKSSVKVGYEGEWFDRSHRDVEHSLENSFVSAVDVELHKDLFLRLSYRHSVRNPEAYDDEAFSNISGGITEEQVNHRRFDEAARIRNRADAQVQYSPFDKVSFSAFANTMQDNYNRRGDTNSATPLNFLTGSAATTNPYFLYGVLKDLSYDYGFDADYAVSPAATLFAEYSHEKYHKRITSRMRTPGGAAPLPMDCSISGRACDSPNNDWESTTRDLVDIYTVGSDFYFGKKVYFTTYYSLSAAKGNVFSRPLGDPTLLTGPNKFLLTGTNAAVDYPETTSRNHDVTVILKYKLTKNLMPKLEYRYQQFDNKDYQTSPMTPYMGCVSGLPPSTPVPGCTSPLLGTPSAFYPYFLVGDTSAARYLFLGVDQPSYRVNYVSATLEYHF